MSASIVSWQASKCLVQYWERVQKGTKIWLDRQEVNFFTALKLFRRFHFHQRPNIERFASKDGSDPFLEPLAQQRPEFNHLKNISSGNFHSAKSCELVGDRAGVKDVVDKIPDGVEHDDVGHQGNGEHEVMTEKLPEVGDVRSRVNVEVSELQDEADQADDDREDDDVDHEDLAVGEPVTNGFHQRPEAAVEEMKGKG